ncbi:hypothetical protein K1719_046435 [Acacia pycnantha]|nr:hypothetical protein K1719_046435 [Acacia pycnantha]
MNNPFEVIARCSQLEELYYVSNDDHILIDAKAPQITSLPRYKIYHIDGSNFSPFDSSQLDTSIKRCFKPAKLQKIFSKELTKSLATRAEILELEGDNEIGWNNLIPSIVSIGYKVMDDLIKLSLKKCYEMRDEESFIEEKVDDEDHNPRSHNSMFSKLKLLSVQGCEALEFILPICFFEDLPLLESVELSKCKNLRYMFDQYPKQGGLHQMQNENILRSLKVMSIEDVPLFVNIYPECYLPQKSIANTSEASKEKDKSPGKYVGNRADGIFTPPLYPCNLREMNIGDISNLRSLFSISIASSMSLLEELVVSNCDDLKHIVTEEVDSHHHMNANSIFPNLRTIKSKECGKLEYVFTTSCSRNLMRLESLFIHGDSQLKYVIGKSCDDDNSLHQSEY